jgi:hypothetical protein
MTGSVLGRHLHALGLHPRASIAAAGLVVGSILALLSFVDVARTGLAGVGAVIIGALAAVLPVGRKGESNEHG